VRKADDSAFDNACQRVDLGFDLLWIDVEAAGDDQILAAAQDVDVTPVVDLAEIAGDEKTVGMKLGRRLFRHAPVALEHIGAAHLDIADIVHCARLAFLAKAAQDYEPLRVIPAHFRRQKGHCGCIGQGRSIRCPGNARRIQNYAGLVTRYGALIFKDRGPRYDNGSTRVAIVERCLMHPLGHGEHGKQNAGDASHAHHDDQGLP